MHCELPIMSVVDEMDKILNFDIRQQSQLRVPYTISNGGNYYKP